MLIALVLLLFSALASALPSLVQPIGGKGQAAGPGGLRFGADGKFNMTVFSDLHFGEEEWRDCAECATYDEKTSQVMSNVLDWEPTSLAVLNGDLLSAEAVLKDDYTKYIGTVPRTIRVYGYMPLALSRK